MSASSQWVVVELTPKAEGEDPDVVRASIRHHIRDAEVFVPASVVQKGDVRVFQYLVDGYAFIRHTYPEAHYARLADTKYVQGPLYAATGVKREKRLAMVTSDQIARLRDQIRVEVDQGIEVGDTVDIISGPYRNISAVVREEIPEQDSVLVHIRLRSTDRLVTLPRGFLRLERKSLTVVYKGRLERLSAWVAAYRSVLSWPARKFESIIHGFRDFLRLERWHLHSQTHVSLLLAARRELSLETLHRKFADLVVLDKGHRLLGSLRTAHNALPSLAALEIRQLEFTYLNDVCERVAAIHGELKQMDQQRAASVNLIIDGTQLFIRCSEAPGLSSLTDSRGRPTGAVVGFLRSLGSYKKRFPSANLYVCWDGTSQRRKLMYPDYKGQRVSRSGALPFGWDWLREVLPGVGVRQAFNPEEEADDVMASLVRGPLKDQPNILVTTDRDLLQLVSETTHQLSPAVGAGREKLYDPTLVETEYGVKPSVIVHLRALSGDSSDNIPGVPNFGLKNAAKAVKLYESVTALLASNLAGLGKGQVANLRSCEKQILLNVELLTLRDVPFHQIESNPNQSAVKARLEDLEIKPDAILAAFFPSI